MRYFLELAFHGKQYHGWQNQPNAIAVQEVVEKAISTLVQTPISITGAGRTDAGVHARQLFAHFEVENALDSNFLFKLNSLLPQDIAVLEIRPVRPEAHARFDALSRTYVYYITPKKDPFLVDSAYWVKNRLDIQLLNQAAQILLEYTNFKSFSRSRTDVVTYNCEIEYAHWENNGTTLMFTIKANRFLRNMVRAIVGTLIDVGLKKIEVSKLHTIIKSQDRSLAGSSAPAHALFLTKIEYPENIFLA